jgi:hypothetical protein
MLTVLTVAMIAAGALFAWQLARERLYVPAVRDDEADEMLLELPWEPLSGEQSPGEPRRV